MKDSNNKEIRTGDFVRVSGGYFKTSNGLFLVTNAQDMPGYENHNSLYLCRVKKSGELCVDSATNSESWPLRSYCSDSRKNREARAHNKEHAKIELAEGVNTFHASEYFTGKAAEYAERAENQRRLWGNDSTDAAKAQKYADFYFSVADRLAGTAEQPKQKEPETGIRFYWNGIKVDGGRLIPCWYGLDAGSVTISAKNYESLPRAYFTVENETDIMTDYFDNDSTTLTPEHPLYRFARYAALKGIMNGRTYRKPTPEQAAEWETMKDPGHPTAANLAAVEEMKTAQENAKKAAERAAQLAEREKCLRKISEGRHYMERVAAEHPVTDGAPTVEIGFSESPYLYSLSHGAENVFSVAAAEIVLKHFDEMKHAENAGYDKTDFIIRWTDEKTGKEQEYQGRYDLGDNDGGLIEHIRAFGRCCIKDEQKKAEICELADWLQTFTSGGRVVSVEIAPGVVDLLAYRKQQEQAKKENAKREWADIMAAVQMLTDEQIEAAVFCVNPQDRAEIDVARFFLQELARRDEKRALEVFKRWQAGA